MEIKQEKINDKTIIEYETDNLALTDPLCKQWCLECIQENSTAIDDPLIDNKNIIKFYYCIGETKHLY